MAENKKENTQPMEKLIKYMEKLQSSGSKVNQRNFFEELMKQEHFLTPAVSRTDAQQRRQLRFPTIMDPEKQHFYMAFTDREQLDRWQPEGKHEGEVFDGSFAQFARMVLDNPKVAGLVINPFGQGMVIGRSMLERLMLRESAAERGMQLQEIEGKTEAEFFDCPEDTAEFEAQVADYLQTRPEVETAYLRWMKRGEQENYLLVLAFEGVLDEVFSEIGEKLTPMLKGRGLAMLPANAKVALKAVEGAQPIYVRGPRLVK